MFLTWNFGQLLTSKKHTMKHMPLSSTLAIKSAATSTVYIKAYI